jgi:hypothetical protein
MQKGSQVHEICRHDLGRTTTKTQGGRQLYRLPFQAVAKDPAKAKGDIKAEVKA